jgi:hypothetical protein
MGYRLVQARGAPPAVVNSAEELLQLARGAPGAGAAPPQGPVAGSGSDYLERVVKYIPSEVVGAYVVVSGLVPDPLKGGSDGWPTGVYLGIYFALVVLTPVYLGLLGGDVHKKGVQIVIGTIAFVIWTYTIGGPLMAALEKATGMHLVYANLGSILLVVSALGFGAFDPKPEAAS